MNLFTRIVFFLAVLIARFTGVLLVSVGVRICFIAATTEEAACDAIPGVVIGIVGVLFLIAKTGVLGDGKLHNTAEKFLLGIYADRLKGK